jgi:ribosomal protein L13E
MLFADIRPARAVRSRAGDRSVTAVFHRDQVSELKASGLSRRQIARRLGGVVGTVRRAVKPDPAAVEACQNPVAEAP